VADTPLDHVLRFEPPWRASRATECGRKVNDLASVIDRDDLIAKVRQHGQQRAVFTTCMTCWERTRYARPWTEDAPSVIARDAYRGRTPDRDLHLELTALTLLWQAHRDEFDELLRGLDDTTDLAAARRARKTGTRSRG
jgi:hypothetical protein